MTCYSELMSDIGKLVARYMRYSDRVGDKYRPSDAEKPKKIVPTTVETHKITVYNGRPYVIDREGIDKTVEALLYAEEYECTSLLVDEGGVLKRLIINTRDIIELLKKQTKLMNELCIAAVRKQQSNNTVSQRNTL